MTQQIGFSAKLGGKRRIHLELTEPNKKDETWSLTAIATVVEDGDPVPDVEVQFYHDGRPIDSAIVTDSEGRATKDFEELNKGNHMFEAKISGTTLKSQQSKNLKGDPSKPKKLSWDDFGKGRSHKILFTVVNEDNKKPVSGVELILVDSGDEKTLPKTNESGSTEYKLDLGLKENHRIVLAKIAGAEKFETIHLFPY